MGQGTLGNDNPDGVAHRIAGSSDRPVGSGQARSRIRLAARVRAVITAADELSRELASILTDIDDDQDILDMIADQQQTEKGHER